MNADIEERTSYHCERLTHDRCVTRGCSCFCHDRTATVPARLVESTEPRLAAARPDGRRNNGRKALREEERVALRAEVNAQRRAAGEGYSSEEIQTLTGLSYRQIDYWARTGVLVPSLVKANGSGSQRRWSEEDLRVLLVAKRLLDAGLSLQSVRGIGDKLRDLPAGTEGYALIDADHVEVVRHLSQIATELVSGRVVHVVRIEP